MAKFLYKILICLTLAFTAAGCSGHNDGPDVSEAPRAVLVYMVANNSLGQYHYDLSDLEEMKIAAKAGDLKDSRLFVYHHSRDARPVLKEITPNGEHIVRQYDTSASSVSSARMTQVISDFTNSAPAATRGIILWSHGSGWIENGIVENAAAVNAADATVSPLSFGDDGGRYMNVTTLARVLQGKGFDYIYFDCCYMAGVEVVYELRRCADYIVGSAIELPSDGMPYDKTLRYLMKKDADLVGAARTTFNHYDNMTGQSRTCAMSVIKTAALDDLADATRSVYALNNASSTGFAPQPFMTSKCYLFDFGKYVDDLASASAELKAKFDRALDEAVVYKASTPAIWDRLTLTYHSGLSTYLPDFSTADRYNYDNLQWASDVAAALDR